MPSLVSSIVVALLAACTIVLSATKVYARPPIRGIRRTKSEITVTRIEPVDDEHNRRLLSCNDYQYRIQIRDNLFMHYVANNASSTMSVKLEYFGTASISLGINEGV
jgi:hypothetical protein